MVLRQQQTTAKGAPTTTEDDTTATLMVGDDDKVCVVKGSSCYSRWCKNLLLTAKTKRLDYKELTSLSNRRFTFLDGGSRTVVSLFLNGGHFVHLSEPSFHEKNDRKGTYVFAITPDYDAK